MVLTFEDQPKYWGFGRPERVEQNRNIPADRESFAQIVRSSEQRSGENLTRRTQQRNIDEISKPPSRTNSWMPLNYPVQDFLDLKS